MSCLPTEALPGAPGAGGWLARILVQVRAAPVSPLLLGGPGHRWWALDVALPQLLGSQHRREPRALCSVRPTRVGQPRGRGCGEHTGLLPCPHSAALALRSLCYTMGSTQQDLENGQAVGVGEESRSGRVEVWGAAPSSEVGFMLAHDSLTLCLSCICILLQLSPRTVAGRFPPSTGPWVC